MDSEQHLDAPTGRRPRGLLIAAATAVAALGVVGAVAVAGGDDDKPVTATRPTVATSAVDSGPVSPGVGVAARCVEQYDVTTLGHRETALDGTVEAVDGDSVTLKVNEWFRGGDADTVTLEGASTIGAMTSVGDAVALEPGSHLLVAGDGGFAWPCGFTQPYDASVADQWRSTLSG